jgi:hypothetical protein
VDDVVGHAHEAVAERSERAAHTLHARRDIGRSRYKRGEASVATVRTTTSRGAVDRSAGVAEGRTSNYFRTLARHALFLEAAWNPGLRPDLLADQLARPDPGFGASAAIRAGLTGLLG